MIDFTRWKMKLTAYRVNKFQDTKTNNIYFIQKCADCNSIVSNMVQGYTESGLTRNIHYNSGWLVSGEELFY